MMGDGGSLACAHQMRQVGHALITPTLGGGLRVSMDSHFRKYRGVASGCCRVGTREGTEEQDLTCCAGREMDAHGSLTLSRRHDAPISTRRHPLLQLLRTLIL